MAASAEVATTTLAKENAAAPAAQVVMSSPAVVEACPQEVPAPLARLTPPAPILAAATEDDQPPEPPVLPEAEVSSVLASMASSPLPSMRPSRGAFGFRVPADP